jgi:hypothetical protein
MDRFRWFEITGTGSAAERVFEQGGELGEML